MTEKFSVVDENRLHPPPKRRGDTIFIVAIVLLAIVGIYYLGTLRRSDSTDSGETPITGQTHRSTPTRSDSADSGETPATGQTHRSAPTVPKEPPIESSPHSADELLRQMIAAYSNAKTYSDDAYIESVYEIQLNGRKRSVSYKIPCNITFEKPNFIRMRVNQGVLVCDGATIRGRINHPAFRSEYIETKAPMLFSSVCELYPDMRLAAAMNMEIPSNILWVPPQLVLLLSASPLKTFIPTGGTATLLSPEAIVRTDPKTKEVQREICDRVAIVAPDGTRVLWIDRSDQTLARFELPIEQIEVPKNVQRVERLRIEFPKRVLSDETVQQSFAQDIFKIQLPDEAELVEQFTPISSKIMGEHLSPISLRPLVSGFAPMTMDQLDGKARVFCFWKGIDPALPPDPPGESQDGSGRQGEGNLPSWNGIEYGVGKKSQAFMAELLKTTELLGFEERKFEFILVNVDAGIEASDEMVRSFLEQSMFDMPLYRFTAEEERKNFVEVFDVPSVIVTDVTGVIQKSYRSQLSATGLFRDVKQILLGTDLTKDHEAGNRKLLTKFQQMLTAADQSDTYCTQSESDREEAPLVVPSATPPANVKMTKAWTIASLPGAMNPTVVPLSALTDPKTPIENDAPVLLVPCEGNSLAVINEQGAVVQKKSATGNVAEPISFVRYFAGKNRPYFAASSRGTSKKVFRFGQGLLPEGFLDLGRSRDQWVVDFCYHDENGNGTPTLYLALQGDMLGNAAPVHGIYCTDVLNPKNPKIHWKDENIFTPRRICVGPSGMEQGDRGLWIVDCPDENQGSIVEDDLSNGKRLQELVLGEQGSVHWLVAEKMQPDGPLEIAVLLHPGPDRLFLAGLSPQGKVNWKQQLPQQSLGGTIEPIIAGDINGDGVKEWIILFSTGTILICSHDGEPVDQYHYGEEITGGAVVHWQNVPHLVITDVKSVTAWKIESVPKNQSSE